MSLKELTVPQEVVETRTGNFLVRGLCADDVCLLIRRHGDAMTDLFNRFAAQDGEITPERVMAFALPMIDAFPVFTAELIAAAADAPEEAGKVRRLPLSVQADALEKVVVLTFDAEGGPGKFAETVVRLLQGTNGLLASLKA